MVCSLQEIQSQENIVLGERNNCILIGSWGWSSRETKFIDGREREEFLQ